MPTVVVESHLLYVPHCLYYSTYVFLVIWKDSDVCVASFTEPQFNKDQPVFTHINSSHARLNLQGWASGGCPISAVTLEFRPKGQSVCFNSRLLVIFPKNILKIHKLNKETMSLSWIKHVKQRISHWCVCLLQVRGLGRMYVPIKLQMCSWQSFERPLGMS